jgi:hypothetical protein
MSGCLEWFEDIDYEYNQFMKRLVAKKYNSFSKMFDVIGEANNIGATDIQYPGGVRTALGFKIESETCIFHKKCQRFGLLDKEGKIISTICKRKYRLDIKLV